MAVEPSGLLLIAAGALLLLALILIVYWAVSAAIDDAGIRGPH